MPSTPDLTAATVMDASASLMNDTAKVIYTYVAQIPYLNMALRELRELFELNGIAVTETSSAAIEVLAGNTTIEFDATPPQSILPTDLVEPSQLWERPHGIDPYVPMTRRDFIPHELEGILTSQFIYWVWQEQKIKLLEADQDNDIKMDYIKQLFPTVTASGDGINVINAQSFLQYRTASLLARYIERNEPSAMTLERDSILALDRVTGISSKSKQTIFTRRRPFRSGWKRRGGTVIT